MADIPEIDLTGAEVLRDPFAAYGRVREASPLARIRIPGMGPVWVVTRHEDARAMLSDPRFGLRGASFLRPDVPGEYLPYLRTMSEMEGSGHRRLRKLVAPAFTPRRAAEFRPRIEPIVDDLLDGLAGHAGHGTVDLLRHFARPLPMDVICELVGIPEADRPRWREYGATVVAGSGPGFAEAVPGIVDDAKAAIASRRAEPADDLLTDLIRAHEDGDRLSDDELVTMVFHLVIAGQTPTNLIANSVAALLSHPEQLAALRVGAGGPPQAVDELIRWCGPTLLTIPRYAEEDVELHGTLVHKGEPITAAVAAVNRDPRAFTEPGRLDLTRGNASAGHLGFGHGPHFCLGASLARVQTEVALTAILRRFPSLSLATPAEDVRAPDPGTWRLTELPVTLR
ncbi:MAG TPA: cytochrome P450 [Amycolatopsis sp.]|uniref:cytochrome P450 family protein n=1 Tax=Amycolatopsis sp. TaxID=37632 RepID=UPI002B49A010|nr:cytochrome P450 [Amycolatopsis sp.]HKS49612.1 cytochrome P450 [Amycolatopsis sp.]